MRSLAIFACLAGCWSCSLIVADRTDPYEGACVDEAEWVAATYDDSGRRLMGNDGRSVVVIATLCTPGCPDSDCIGDCVSSQTQGSISSDCGGCFGELMICGRERCTNECSGLRPDACIPCLCGQGCAQEIEECSGLSPLPCP